MRCLGNAVRVTSAILLCAALLPLGDSVRRAMRAEPDCATHGAACACHSRGHASAHQRGQTSSPGMACHRGQKAHGSLEEAASEKPASQSQVWARCGCRHDQVITLSERPYLTDGVVLSIRFLHDEESVISGPAASPFGLRLPPPSPPPRS